MKLLLDLDGVCADFIRAICITHNKPYPYREVENLGHYNLVALWEMTDEEFFAPLNSVEWWIDILPMPDLSAIKELIFKYFKPEDICILSKPPSTCPWAMVGKWIWCAKHLPEIKNKIFGTTKEFCACRDTILLDDDQSKVDKFRMAGGRGVLVPRPWNSMFDHSGELFYIEASFEAMFMNPVADYT